MIGLTKTLSAVATTAAGVLGAAAAHCWWMCADTMPGAQRAGIVYRLTGLPCDPSTAIGLLTTAIVALAFAMFLPLLEIGRFWKLKDRKSPTL